VLSGQLIAAEFVITPPSGAVSEVSCTRVYAVPVVDGSVTFPPAAVGVVLDSPM
jgi:hypothetical protein